VNLKDVIMGGVDFPVGSDRVYLVAEAEINHNGSLATALDMVRAASEAEVDAIKFQYIVADQIAAKGSSYYELFKGVELGLNDFLRIRELAAELGLDFFVTAPSLTSLPEVDGLEPRFIKIGSSNITNLPLLRGIARLRRPVILSTGGSSFGDIERALSELKGLSVALLHCTIRYPAEPKELNLRAITSMRAGFPGRLIGYSDHSIGITAAVAAVALGARIIEKHFTLDRCQEGPDHGFSADPADLAKLSKAVRDCESALGSGEKVPCVSEQEITRVARRFVVAARDLAQGTVITEQDLDCRRVNFETGLVRVEEFDFILGMCAPRAYKAGEGFNWKHFKPAQKVEKDG